MSIKYKMIQRGDNLNPQGKKKIGFYPQVVRSETINTDELAMILAQQKKFKAIETKATIDMFLMSIEEELLKGNSVCLEGFGTFSLTAKTKRRVSNPDEIRAESIAVKKIVFTPSKPLIGRMKNAKFVKIQDK